MRGRPEDPLIATLDDANAAQQEARAAVRRLLDRLQLDPETARDLEIIIRATHRTQGYHKLLRALVKDI